MKLSAVFVAAGAALFGSALPAVTGVEANVPAEERTQYERVYALEILPDQTQYDQSPVPYAVDNHLSAQPFKRVAYYLELRRPGEEAQWIWVSMDAFTKDAAKIGVPTPASQAFFQQRVTNLRIWSNAEGVILGERTEGSVEFWPNSYGCPGTLGLGGNDNVYDFDDQVGGWRYGSLQVHDHLNKTTLLAYNRWSSHDEAPVDLGIGNAPGEHPDWTLHGNAGEYEVRRLEVWTMPDVEDATPPVPRAARIAASRMQVLVSFEAALAEGQNLARAFTLDDGTVVGKAELTGADRRTVRLTLAAQATPGARLTVAGLRAASPAATRMLEAVTLELDDATPAHVRENVGELMDGYQLVYDLAIPVTGDFNARGAKMYDLDDAALFKGTYDRVGYYLELVAPTLATQYVWVSFAPHTAVAGQLGVPLVALNCHFQQYVESMDVKSNVDGVTNGTGFPQGNVEMWPDSYGHANDIGIVNAAGDAYDWGDRLQEEGSDYGSFQVHNAGESQVVFALNNWGSDGNTLDVGIGTCGGNNRDWTFAQNAGGYVSRRLLVFVRATSQDYAPNPVTFRRATADVGRTKICCSFDTEPTAEQTAQANFTCLGAVILGAEVSPLDARDVILTLAGPLAADAEASVTFRDPATGAETTHAAGGASGGAGGNRRERGLRARQPGRDPHSGRLGLLGAGLRG